MLLIYLFNDFCSEVLSEGSGIDISSITGSDTGSVAVFEIGLDNGSGTGFAADSKTISENGLDTDSDPVTSTGLGIGLRVIKGSI